MNDKKSRPSIKIAYLGRPLFQNPVIYLDGIATMIGKRPETPFPAIVCAFWIIPQRILEIIILNFEKVLNQNYGNFTTTSPNKGFNDPLEQNHRE